MVNQDGHAAVGDKEGCITGTCIIGTWFGYRSFFQGFSRRVDNAQNNLIDGHRARCHQRVLGERPQQVHGRGFRRLRVAHQHMRDGRWVRILYMQNASTQCQKDPSINRADAAYRIPFRQNDAAAN